VLVNLNYRISVHMNFAQSRIPALFCSPQSEYGCYQVSSYGGQRGNATPNSKVFTLIKYLKYKSKKYFSANQQNFLKEPILLQLLVEYKLASNFCNHNQWPQVKTSGVTLFTGVSGVPAYCIPPNGYESFISRPSQIPFW